MLPPAREVWRRAQAPETAPAILALPVAFREAVFYGLGRDRNPEALQHCLDLAADRAVKKSLKRRLYELRKLGFTASVVKRSILSPKPVADETSPSCFVTPIDAQNERMLFIAIPARTGMHALTVVDAGDTIVDFRYELASRKIVRRHLDDLRRVRELLLFEIDFAFAAYMLSRVRTLSHDAGRFLPAGLVRAISEMKLAANLPARHPYHDLVDGQTVLDQLTRLDHSDLLHAEPEFVTWSLDHDAVLALKLSVDELNTSRLVVDDAQRGEQLRYRLQRAVDQFFTDRRRAIFAERLRDAAWLLAKRNATAQAHTAAALAMRLENPQVVPSSIPFFQQMVAKLLPPPPAEKEKDQPPSGLILP